MRLGVVLDLAVVGVEQVAGLAREVEQAGLDVLWLRPQPDQPWSGLPAAASTASTASALHVGVETIVGSSHPLYLAEERHVVDQLLGGRLVLDLRGPQGDDEADNAVLAEWTEVLLRAASTLPFAHHGANHRIPGGLPQNVVNPEERLVVTPQPFALEPHLWVSGPGAATVAADHGLSLLSHDPDDVAGWAHLETELGRRALRLRRPALRTWDPATEDAVALAARLVDERDGVGLDTALVQLDIEAGSSRWRDGLGELARVVRPRVQQDRLPAGLEAFWDDERHTGIHLHDGTDHLTSSERH